jgi:hypothetical protein
MFSPMLVTRTQGGQLSPYEEGNKRGSMILLPTIAPLVVTLNKQSDYLRVWGTDSSYDKMPMEPKLHVKCGLEAPSGFEPLHRSFADCSLTTWVRRPGIGIIIVSFSRTQGKNDTSTLELICNSRRGRDHRFGPDGRGSLAILCTEKQTIQDEHGDTEVMITF